ncbi:hypothetical protein ECC02_002754 [Trypanosoma cruzi]|uniref:ATP synthase regulation protein NCA2 n=1 Tax=Trypanosoma cruzi TaxID=5693 RepID=A0A7J6YDI6_TRYCR|nr:hypothetical protein ECC02_002754 [Trypanosoma cruzi]
MFRESNMGGTQDWRSTKPSSNVHFISSSTFATALATRSCRTFLQFTHSPAVVELLSEWPGIGNDMETYALQLRNLDDLAGLLQCIKFSQGTTRMGAQVSRTLRGAFAADNMGSLGSDSGANLPSATESNLIGWLQLLVWTRFFAVFSMRQLAAIHDQISWYLWYWSWAEVHSARASVHLALGRTWWWEGFLRRGWMGQVLLVKSYAIAHKSALNRVLHGVVRTLGAVYSLVDRMNTLLSSMEDTAAGDRLLSQEPGAGISTEIPPNYHRLVSNVCATVVSTMKLMAHTLRPQGTTGFLDAHSRGMPGETPYVGGCAGELMIFEFPTRTPSEETPERIETSASLKDIFNLLLDTLNFTRNYTKSISEDIHTRHVPPNGRHWQRLLLAGCTVVPSVILLSSHSVSNLRRVASSARVVLRSLMENYVMYPIKEIYKSLTSSRPGVLERRRTLEMEMESVANIIRDYHEDYYPSIPHDELQRLRDRTLKHLRSGVIADDEGYCLINQHYENAIRHPIRSAFFGNLLRLMLIQLTYQQLEVMRVVNSTDEVLEGNDLNFKIMAMVPVFLFLSGLLFISFQKRRASLRPVNNQLKLYWRSVHRVVTFPEDLHDEFHVSRSGDDVSMDQTKDNDALELLELGSANHLNSHDQGMLLLLTHHMRRLAVEYHVGYSHLQEFLEDLDDLESVQSTRYQRLLTLERMRHIYYFLW